MKLIIEIKMDGAAFEELPGSEVARILRQWADRLDNCDFMSGKDNLRDINGNICGFVKVEE
jgi:hypothetical protein